VFKEIHHDKEDNDTASERYFLIVNRKFLDSLFSK
jgi:hypothetical protein